jgi:CheY-like chemotaxis protein
MLFNPFTQADASTTRQYGGTGLGLSISERLVEMMGGKISVTSKAGQGSTFSFYVMMQACDDDELAQEADGPSNPDEPDGSEFDGLRVLLAEDNAINQEIASVLLEDIGMRLDIVADGKQAVDAFCNKDYDLIFMDVRMPVMDGLEATREIRRIEAERERAGGEGALGNAKNVTDATQRGKTHHITIVAMTANAMQEDQEQTRAAGMDGHVSKPIDMDELKTTLRSLGVRAQG